MSSTQKQGQSNKSGPSDPSSLSSNAVSHDIITRSVNDTQNVLSESPRTTTTQNLMADERSTYASNQPFLQNTTSAIATCMSDLSLNSGNSTLKDLGANSSITQAGV